MKNKVLSFLLVIGVLTFLVGCSKITKSINGDVNFNITEETKEEIIKGSNGVDTLKVTMSKPVFEDKEELKFAKNDVELITNEMMDNYKTELIVTCEKNLDTMREGDLFTAKSKFKSFNNKVGMISLLFIEDTYTGGMHGSEKVMTANYDVANQKKLEFSDLFVDGYLNDLKEKVSEKIDLLIKDQNYAIYQNYEEKFECAFKSDSFYLDGDNLVIVYNQYDIAPYSEGTIYVEIKLSEIKNILSDRFKSLLK